MSKIFKTITLFIIMLLNQYSQAVPPPAPFIAKFAVFSKDNSKLVYLKSQNNSLAYSIIHRNTRTGKIIKEVPVKVTNNVAPFAATPDGFKLLATNPHGISVIHNGVGKVLRTLPHPSKIKDWRFTPVQSHDGVLLAIPSIGPQFQGIYLIHTGSGKIIRTIKVSKDKSPHKLPIIRAIGFNQDRHVVAYLQRDEKDSTLHLYDIYHKKEKFSIKMPKPYYDYGQISFSQNGKHLLFQRSGKKGIELIHLQKKTVKTLTYDFSSFASFTADDRNIIVILPFENSISIENISTGAVKKLPITLQRKDGDYGWGVAQSVDRKLLALPFTTRDYGKMDQFLFIDGNTGKLLF